MEYNELENQRLLNNKTNHNTEKKYSQEHALNKPARYYF